MDLFTCTYGGVRTLEGRLFYQKNKHNTHVFFLFVFFFCLIIYMFYYIPTTLKNWYMLIFIVDFRSAVLETVLLSVIYGVFLFSTSLIPT